MFGKNKKEMNGGRKNKKSPLKHSTMGRNSCIFAGLSVGIFLVAVWIAFIKRGQSVGMVGGLGILSMVVAALGCKAAMKGFRERERNYLNCKIGMTLNILILIGLLIVFIGGLV